MKFPLNFISASDKFCTFEECVPSPFLRKSFYIDKSFENAYIVICGLGFYNLFINGKKITKGFLAPYISAPDDILYYDKYDLTELLRQGENVIGVCLGNGMLNAFGGYVWDLDKARWRSAPKVAADIVIKSSGIEETIITTDTGFKVSASPIYFDDLRCGEYYDARNERPGWNNIGFDDSSWGDAVKADCPHGETVLCSAEPIIVAGELRPVRIEKQETGYLYDFGKNTAGVCRLKVSGSKGQVISMSHGECIKDGHLLIDYLKVVPNGYVQKDIYICSGINEEIYTPSFTYHGFRYVFVEGINAEQATEELLTYLILNSDLKECGGFECSDPVINSLQEITRRSTLANFYYFPTDCPQREKNGWTGDAALSAEHTLLNLTAEQSYAEWLRNIRKAQNSDGALPGIVPTAGWGFDPLYSGPAWDCVLTWLPYYTYLYRGNKKILEDNATAIFRYIDYLSRILNADCLVEYGLGDWCPPGRGPDKYKSPLIFTDSVVSMDICRKAAFIFNELSLGLQASFAKSLYSKIRSNIRKVLINFNTMTALGNCQTSQSMALFYDVFEPGEKPEAFKRLLELIEETDGCMDTGILGARVLFHVLSEFGKSDLAVDMITTPNFPSYGNWLKRGATSLWEAFWTEETSPLSMNHHFFGDISSWFIKCLAGIKLNPSGSNVNEVDIIPAFPDKIDFAKAYHIAPAGKIESGWQRSGKEIELLVSIPSSMKGKLILPNGYMFEDGLKVKVLTGGAYRVINISKKETI